MKKPNVLIIYPDQMRYDTMGGTHNPVLKTPALDRLSAEGIHFTQAFTSFPLCCPFRASLLTGKYATSHGMLANHYPINLEQTFLPQLFRSNGYETAWVGKWHLNGGPKHDYVPQEYRLGFEHFIGFSRGHEYLNPIYYRDDDQTPYKSQMFEPDMQTGHLLDFIDHSLGQDAPFFAAIGYGIPHPPVHLSPDYYQNLYSPEEVPIPDWIAPEQQQQAREFLAKYYGLVAATDAQIMKILDHLQLREVLDDTIVILVSDHGEQAYEHGLMGKKVFYNSSMHVPFVIRYPRLGVARREAQIVDPSVDLMPTVLELCGLAIPQQVEGHSLATLLRQGQDASLPSYVFYQIPIEKEGPEKHPQAERGIRTPQWLYVEVDAKPSYLFDLVADPNELTNLIHQPCTEPVQKQMAGTLQKVMEQYGDRWDNEIVFPPPNFQTHEEGAVYNKSIYARAILKN